MAKIIEALSVTPPQTKPKKIGDSITAEVSFRHRGKGVPAYISWGIAPGSPIPGDYFEGRIVWVATRIRVATGDDSDWTTYTTPIPAKFPDIKPLSLYIPAIAPLIHLPFLIPVLGKTVVYNAFDCYIIVEWDGKKLTGWWDDQYSLAVVEPEFKELTAVFT